ncbi:MAG: ABC-F family ATP-binding cassette domain-containing protein [Flavobacteriales bacterium]|nr:ABC-F family ATP-binding cassette domain-containing protein [Flavobacteriales bacterium]MCB9447329.1 ABC-F family ATP-binding cassette domain-containing protein [Flavobacteriales bacterium]
MQYIYAENLSVHYGERTLFKDLTFGLNRGDKVALVANNGSGKSTLLRILAGKDQANEGSVFRRESIRMGYLEQAPAFPAGVTIRELISGSHTEVTKVIEAYHKALEAQSEDYSPQTQKALELATHAMDECEAWDYDRRMQQILSRFEITDLEQKVDTLSGGQQKRLALAMTLLDSPQLLLLDEPTNHLDVDMIEWLEDYLGQNNVTVFMVTHDRYFLDRVCNHIIELEDERIYHHKGNYTYFLEKRDERETIQGVEKTKAGKLLKKELEWIRRQPKARGTKSKSRVDAYHDLADKHADGKVKQELNLEVKMTRIGGKILELKKVYKSYGDRVIMKGFDYTFKKGDHIGIVGRNGVGKSTFLNIITGSETADSGKVNVGETIVFGYYSQQGLALKEDKRVIEVLQDIAEVITMADGKKVSASQFLEYFMFPPHIQYNPVSKLSGGERRRLYLLTVLIRNPNFLILDEPTNDLDILTLTRLEEFLQNYPGCLLIVSHDRYFMDKLADHLFVFKGNGEIKDYYHSYSSYRELARTEEKEARKDPGTTPAPVTQDASQPVEQKEKKKLGYKERRELMQLEKDIATLETEKGQLESDLQTHASDMEKVMSLTARYDVVNKELDEKSDRWLTLSELA